MEKIDKTTELIKNKFGETKVSKAIDLPIRGIIPTGILSIDKILTNNGLPKGCLVEIFGAVGSGKSTLSYNIIAQAQKEKDFYVVIADTEYRFFPEYVKKCGVDLNRLVVIHPEYAEEALEIGEQFLRTGDVNLFIIDSVAGLVPKKEADEDMETQQIGLQARIVTKAVRKLISVASKTNSIIIWVNQLREKVGVLFGQKEDTPGGRGLKHFSTVRLDLRRIELLKEKDEIIGTKSRIKVTKGLGGEGRTAEFSIKFDGGIDFIGSLALVAIEEDIIKKSGLTYIYNNEKIAVGSKKLDKYLEENKEIYNEIYLKIIGDKGA